MNNLKIGSRGPEVEQLQQYLKSLGIYTGNIDGVFGPKTNAAVQAFQGQNNIKIDGIVGPITKQKMQTSSSMNDPRYQSVFENDPIALDIFNRAKNLGDLRLDAITNVATNPSFSGQFLGPEELQSLYNEEYNRLGGYFDELRSYDKSALDSQLGLSQREYERYLADSASEFGKDKDADDVRSAQSGILFSTGREEGLRGLENTYRSQEEAIRDKVATGMSDAMRNYQYDWGGDGMKKISKQYKLGSQNYDAFTPRGVVSSGGIRSVYNPSNYDFSGRQNEERKKLAKIYQNTKAGTIASGQGVYGYQNQF